VVEDVVAAVAKALAQRPWCSRITPVELDEPAGQHARESLLDASTLFVHVELGESVRAGDDTEDAHGVVDADGCRWLTELEVADDRRPSLTGEERGAAIQDLPWHAQQ